MFRLRLLLSFLVLLTAGLAAGDAFAQPRIEWEIANRFRLFKKEEQFRKLAEVFTALPEQDRRERPAFAFEDAMQRAAAARTLGPAFGDPSSVDRWGWTSAVTRETCFQNGNRGHWQCLLDTGDQFMEPRVADVLVRIADLPPALAGKPCRWTAGELAVVAPCSGEARLARRAFGEPFDIAVSAEGSVVAEAKTVKLRHIAIAGFGDSFSSGEGNPDRPAELVDDGLNTYRNSSRNADRPGYRNYPRRRGATEQSLGGAAAAIWLNAQCHRSLYSQHVRAALVLAMAHRDVAVTLTPYSCTGAEVSAGVLGYYAARDDVGEAVYDASPQLMRYWRDYCRSFAGYNRFDGDEDGFDWRRDLARCSQPRAMKPDAVLLSIGGNDIGFSSVIAEEVVGRGQFGLRLGLLYKLWLSQIDTRTFAEARKAVDEVIPARIRELSAAFEKHLDVPASAIVQTAYPQMMRSEGGAVCAVSDAGMDLHRILSISKDSTGREGAAFIPYLNRGIASAIGTLPEARRWRFVDSHVERFAGHALCTEGAPAGAPDRQVSGAMRFPSWNFAQRRWEPFAPSAWRAYRPRQRWFVTPNDSFLTGHYMRVGRLEGSDTTDPLSPEQPLFAATLGGSFHPNASGHSAIADATIPVLREVLKLPQP